MKKFTRFTDVSVFIFLLSASIAQAGVFGNQGPLVPDSNGNWRDYRTSRDESLPTEKGDDPSCYSRTTKNLRELFFEHFRYYVDHSKTRITEREVARFAKVLGMAPHESSGATAAVTDMRGTGSRTTLRHFFNTDNKGTLRSDGFYSTLKSVDQLMAMKVESSKAKGKTRTKTVQWTDETNFGLLQMSANRLWLDFGNDEAKIATKTIQSMKALYATHPEDVIDRCGTKLMFKDSDSAIRESFNELQKCQPGAKSKAEVQCFGRWAILCPNYNVTLALIAPPAYFATRRASPLCAKTFRKILNGVKSEARIPAPVSKLLKVEIKSPTPVLLPVRTIPVNFPMKPIAL